MRSGPGLALIFAPLALSGCLAKAAVDVATAPVRIASAGVDAVTTSQAEADQQRGREMRRREERLGELQRNYDRQAKKCDDGNDRACREAVEIRRDIDLLLPTLPAEPAND